MDSMTFLWSAVVDAAVICEGMAVELSLQGPWLDPIEIGWVHDQHHTATLLKLCPELLSQFHFRIAECSFRCLQLLADRTAKAIII